MPLGFERLNERTQRPNALINFIRPLPGDSSKTSESILNRVAAICYPFMKSNMIVIQALEEFPYNTEFVGRNFNAGEVIQLVLKDRNGCWLPQRLVEMVMVHELAHCKQMNHSKAFWKVRDAYAVELKALWAGGYTGEGLWGRGRTLDSGTLQLDNVNVGDMPEHLCGGTYGRKSRKRRRNGKGKEQKALSYAEKKQRRILKKFGTGGQTLGADDSVKSILENNTLKKGKPRVAGSARGRELRAVAALARFETAKKDEAIKEEGTTSDSDTEVEFEESGEEEAAIDVDGRRILDDKGRPLVRLCEDEDDNDKDAQREMEDIEGLQTSKSTPSGTLSRTKHSPLAQSTRQKEATPLAFGKLSSKAEVSKGLSKKTVLAEEQDKAQPDLSTDISWPKDIPCEVCSLIIDPDSITCVACSNVLRLNLVPERWRCQSLTCKGSKYINSGDVAICGICGIRRPSAKNSFS